MVTTRGNIGEQVSKPGSLANKRKRARRKSNPVAKDVTDRRGPFKERKVNSKKAYKRKPRSGKYE